MPPARTRPVTEIWTERLVLRPLGEADLLALHELCGAPGVRRYLWDDHVLSVDETRGMLAANADLYAGGGLGLWGARKRDHGDDLHGFAGYWYFRTPPQLEIVFAVAESRWGHGYATEMASGLLAYGFEVLGLDEVRASTDAPNRASVRVLEKIGFRRVRRSAVDGPETLFFSAARPPAG
jgi:ribosomal-protein-alanine N-acetyltransferase